MTPEKHSNKNLHLNSGSKKPPLELQHHPQRFGRTGLQVLTCFYPQYPNTAFESSERQRQRKPSRAIRSLQLKLHSTCSGGWALNRKLGMGLPSHIEPVMATFVILLANFLIAWNHQVCQGANKQSKIMKKSGKKHASRGMLEKSVQLFLEYRFWKEMVGRQLDLSF